MPELKSEGLEVETPGLLMVRIKGCEAAVTGGEEPVSTVRDTALFGWPWDDSGRAVSLEID